MEFRGSAQGENGFDNHHEHHHHHRSHAHRHNGDVDAHHDEKRSLVTSTNDSATAEYKVYKRRWLMLIAFSMLSMANAILWITFSPISDKVEDFYSITSTWVNFLSVSYMIVYVPLVFPAAWVLDRVGLQYGLWIGGFLTVLGGWVRVIGEWGFAPVAAGQIIAGVGQPFILNAVPLLAVSWFPAHQRTIATTIGSVANPVGIGFGFLLPSAFGSSEQIIPLMLMYEAIIATGLCLPLMFFRSKPPTPPSAAAESRLMDSFFHSLVKLARDYNFWFGMGLGAFNTLATIVNEIIQPYGYSDTQSGVIGALVIVMGIVGSAIVGLFVDWSHRYKLSLIVSLIGGTASMAGLTLVLGRDHYIYMCLVSVVLGLTMTPVLPVGLELSCEIGYPIGEATVTGWMMVFGQLGGIAQIFVINYLIDKHDYKTASWILTGCVGASLVAIVFFNGKLKRLEHDREEKKLDEERQKGAVVNGGIGVGEEEIHGSINQ